MTDCPPRWAPCVPLYEICAIKRVDKNTIQILKPLCPSSDAGRRGRNRQDRRQRDPAFRGRAEGYTPFRKGDVLFAKITPCMENGKMAVVPNLVSEYGFGSTEFHVLRAADGIDPRFLYHAISNRAFRFHAEHNMTGAVRSKARTCHHSRGARNRVAASERTTPHRQTGSRPCSTRSTGESRAFAMPKEPSGSIASHCSSQPSKVASPPTGGQKNPDKLECPDALLGRIREQRQDCYKAALRRLGTRSLATGARKAAWGKRPAKPKRPARHSAEPIEVGIPWRTPGGMVYQSMALSKRGGVRNGISAKDEMLRSLNIFRISATLDRSIDLNDQAISQTAETARWTPTV